VPTQLTAHLLPGGLSLDGLHARLSERLQLAAGPSSTIEATVLDTFDGRVRAGGRVLVHDGLQLVLSTLDGEEVAAAPVARRPERLMAEDLAPGPLADALGPLLDIRTATPLARLRVRRRVLRVLDEERKTVVRIALDEATTGTGAQRTPLAPRVRPLAVRGYDKALRRVVGLLEDELGLAPAGSTLADDAIAAAGRRPEGVRAGLAVDLEPHQRADGAAVLVATSLLETIEANLPGTLADTDTEFLHDLRVAVRRTRALQRELKAVFPPAELARLRGEFRWLQQVTGATRDLDVQLLEFDDEVAGLPAAQRPDVEPLRRLVADRRRRERARMARALRSPRTRALLDDWRTLLGELGTLPEEDRPDAARPVARLAARRISAVYRRMVRMGSAIGDDSPAEDLHDLRKKGKELRYLLEFFATLFPPGTVRPMVKTLKALQDTLGRFQDREVQAQVLRELGREMAAREDGPAALMAMGVLAARLEEEQAQARAEFAERFGPFAAKERRAAVKETFA
jgi:CHAD domain-containing protein